MKKIKLLSALFLSLIVLQGCSDAEVEGTQDADIIGVWTVSDMTFDFTINNESLATFYENSDDAVFIESFYSAALRSTLGQSTLDFKADKTYSINTTDELIESGTWALNSDNNTLTLDDGSGNVNVFQITSSGSGSLGIQFSDISNDDYNDDGVEDEFKIVIDLTLTK